MGQARRDATGGTDSIVRDYCEVARQYAKDVVEGRIPSCHWIKLLCERQLRELEVPPEGYHWNPVKAALPCFFLELMPHVKGRWSSRNIVLEPWQIFHLSTIFGWVDEEGFRRYRKVLILVGRKNAKTTIAAGIANYMLTLDGEPGAEIYSAARQREQAKIVWEVAGTMIQKSPDFALRYGVDALKRSITVRGQNSFFKPLSKDAKSLEGANPHCWIADELHAHKTREVFDALNQGTGSRKQPLGLMITTEGDNPIGILAEQVEYAKHVLSGKHHDPHYYAALYTLDKGDQWDDPISWAKANPNLGVSVSFEELQTLAREATFSAEAQATFITKRCNVRVGASFGYFNMLAYKNLCEDRDLVIEDFEGERCYIGVDLASKIDLCAIVRLFPMDDGRSAIFPRFYLPSARLESGKPQAEVYRGWNELGLLTVIDGPKIDQKRIKEDLIADCNQFNVIAIGIDRWQAENLIKNLEDEDLPAIEVPMNTLRLSEPMKELDADILAGLLAHDGNPILEWNIGNVVARVDANDNVFPRKAYSANKIDGAIALILAKDQLMRNKEEDSIPLPRSVNA